MSIHLSPSLSHFLYLVRSSTISFLVSLFSIKQNKRTVTKKIDEKLAQRGTVTRRDKKIWFVEKLTDQKMTTHGYRHEFYFPSANQTFPDESKSESCFPNSQSHSLTTPDHIPGSSCYVDADREEPHKNPPDMSEPLRENFVSQFSERILDLFSDSTGQAHEERNFLLHITQEGIKGIFRYLVLVIEKHRSSADYFVNDDRVSKI